MNVVVNTPRNDEQTRALEEVNGLIEMVLERMKENLSSSKDVSAAAGHLNTKNHPRGVLHLVSLSSSSPEPGAAFQTIERFLNACSPDEPNGPIDQKFQAKVVECTADDQKKIRRRLAQMITQIDRAQRTCLPQY